MSDEILDRVYAAKDPEELRGIYDEWATAYDTDLADEEYATPGRIAEALTRHLHDDEPVLDFACGTGLSGAALVGAGLTTLDGYDVSTGMLDVARATGIYRDLIGGDPDQPFAVDLTGYRAVVACGAISPGAAPAQSLDDIMDGLAPDGLFVVSLNEHALADDDFVGRIERAVEGGRFEQLEAENGPHLPKHGLTATVFVLRRR